MDTLIAIIRRKVHHQRFDEADKGHLHHKLMFSLELGQTKSVLILYIATALFSICSFIHIYSVTASILLFALLLEQGGNKDQVIICHNFFPERYSGLDWNYFVNFNAYWKSLNLHTAAFVSSNQPHTHGPWNVFCGIYQYDFT